MRSLLLLTSFISLSTFAAADPANSTSGQLLEGVAAVVNNHIILQSELSDAAKKLKSVPGVDAGDPKKVLDQLINDYLVEQEVTRLGLAANDGSIDGAIAQVMKQNGFASLAELKKALGKENIGFEEYRNSIKKQIETYRIMNEAIRPRVQISEQDISAEFNRRKATDTGKSLVQLKMIFKMKGSKGGDKKGMEQLQRQIKTGIPFEKIADRETEGPGKGEGGNIGAVDPSDMQPELTQVIKTMKAGDLSHVITTSKGAYILLCVGFEKAAAPTMTDEVRKELTEKLTNDETARQFDSFIRGLREKAQIEVM